jgi:hypothetical protein
MKQGITMKMSEVQNECETEHYGCINYTQDTAIKIYSSSIVTALFILGFYALEAFLSFLLTVNRGSEPQAAPETLRRLLCSQTWR